MKKAYDSFVEMKAIENGPDELLEKRWGRFLTMLEKVGGAVGPEGRTSTVQRFQMQQQQQQQQQQGRGIQRNTKKGLRRTYAGSTRMEEIARLETAAGIQDMMSQLVHVCQKWRMSLECV